MTNSKKTDAAQPKHLVTFFDDKFARVKYEDTLSLEDLADEIRNMTDVSKQKLPWLKLARFGEQRSKKNCLRTDKNLIEIHGVEIDYDGGTISFDVAVSLLLVAGIKCIIYTSASHTPEKPRWRVLAPTSKALAPSCRVGLAAILNGVLGGAIAGESFVLSTAYYYGYVGDGAHHRVEVIDGDYIDLRDDLWGKRVYWSKRIYKQPKEEAKAHGDLPPPKPGAAPGYDDGDIAEMLESCRKSLPDGSGQWHNIMLSVTGSLVSKGWTDKAIYDLTAPYCDAGWGDGDLEKLIAGARSKWRAPDPDQQPDLSETIGPIVAKAAKESGQEIPEGKTWKAGDGPPPGSHHDDYYAYLRTHQYIYRHTGRLYPLASINATLGKIVIGTKPKKQTKKQKEAGEEPEMVADTMPAGVWLDRNRPVMDMSWSPDEGELIRDRLPTEGGWVHRKGVHTFNEYRPPVARPGDASKADRWLDLLGKVYPDHVNHIIGYFAHRIQKPGEKINHALVLTGSPGIGKDTLLEPLKRGVGEWNFKEISPHDITSNNNDFMQSVVLRVSETRDLGEINRYAFYEATKTMTAAPPDMVRVNIKHVPQFYIPNITSVIFTTNYPADGLYLPPDDRRHYVCGTDLARSDVWDACCLDIWAWYRDGGADDVVAYLRAYDLSAFSAKLPPEKTAAFWRMVDAGRAPEEGEIRDAITKMGDPVVLSMESLISHADYELATWIKDRNNRRNFARRLDECGYIPVRNPDDSTGRWKIAGNRRTVYGLKTVSIDDRYSATREFKRRADEAHQRARDEIGKMTPKKQ